MGCFLVCFGGSKRRNKKNKIIPKFQRDEIPNPTPSTTFTEQCTPEIEKSPIDLVTDLRNEPEEDLSSSPRKKVTFNSNIIGYEPVSISTESLPDINKSNSKNNLSSAKDSVTSIIGAYPINHRYQNCREIDDEPEEHDDFDDVRTSSEESEPLKAVNLSDQETEAKDNVRDTSVYIDSVLNPVENLTQWKTVKYTQKENSNENLETPPRILLVQKHKNSKQEICVDASLSNWLVSPNYSGSNSVISWEDRPILGALTVEELKHLSPKLSPKKSPNRSPDDMPIIGTVGSYWTNTDDSANDSNSVSSFKGIPNTNSKYREDKKVNWHTTPFETRLERALKRNTMEA